jgi:hypothetical protein
VREMVRGGCGYVRDGGKARVSWHVVGGATGEPFWQGLIGCAPGSSHAPLWRRTPMMFKSLLPATSYIQVGTCSLQCAPCRAGGSGGRDK